MIHISIMCRPIFHFSNWITFGMLQRMCLFYLWTALLLTVHTFVVIISLHIGKYAILVHLVWLNRKKLGFTLFLLYSHKCCTAALVRCLLSTPPIYSTVNCTSAISYDYDATNCAAMNSKWRNNPNNSCSAISRVPTLGTFAYLKGYIYG